MKNFSSVLIFIGLTILLPQISMWRFVIGGVFLISGVQLYAENAKNR